MPAAITHYYQALRAWNGYRKAAGSCLRCREAFLWGAQGPDFLFYHRLLQPGRRNLRELGGRLHRETPSRLLGAMRDVWRAEGDGVTESYLYGFLCHYSLDRTAHPFVYADVRALHGLYPGRGDDFLHNHVESVLDGIVLRSLTGKLPGDFDLRRTVPENREVRQAVSRLYAGVLERLYGIRGDEPELLRSMRDCRRICGMLNDPTTVKKTAAELLERLTGRYMASAVIRGISEPDDFDYANILHGKWRWPPESGKTHRESFFDLFDRSVRESVRFLQRFPTERNLSGLTLEIPFC